MAIKEMQARAPEFLAYLKDLQTKGKEIADYKDNLDDAVDATNDALRTANESEGEVAPPPARRAAMKQTGQALARFPAAPSSFIACTRVSVARGARRNSSSSSIPTPI